MIRCGRNVNEKLSRGQLLQNYFGQVQLFIIMYYTPQPQSCYLKNTSFYLWHFQSLAITCIVLFQTGSFVNGSTKFRGALVVGNISFRSLTVTACHFVLLSSPLAYLLSNL